MLRTCQERLDGGAKGGVKRNQHVMILYLSRTPADGTTYRTSSRRRHLSQRIANDGERMVDLGGGDLVRVGVRVSVTG